MDVIDIPAHVPPHLVTDINIFALPGAETDYIAAWLALQERGPDGLIWTTANGGHWIGTRGDVVRSLWADTTRLSNEVLAVVPGLGEAMQLIPLQQDGATHKTFRDAVMKGFAGRHIAALEPQVQALARELAQGLVARGSCEFMSEYAEILPVDIFLSLIDVPVGDRLHLRPLAAQLVRPDGSMGVIELRDAVDDYLRPRIVPRITNPGSDLFSRILAEPVHGRPWTEDEALRMARNILFAGLDTVAALVGMTAMHLALHPQDQQLLRDNPDLIPAAADEFTRRYPSASVSRNAVEDVQVGDLTIRKGDIVYLPSVLHNLDAGSFDDPMAFRLDRKLNPTHHTTMGVGAHRCVGAGLARMELIVFLREWLAIIPPFTIAPGGRIAMKGGNVGTCTHLPIAWA
ncbi:cytochrome P450 [Novosphingobium sp. FSY-8]|uniref:Cytochrome P450 n=1 Tax=Novosphingobium ovatum TaxID=1908523 RepID=A0ABW9XI89_9SPHN|nr:cytochrome P450 [Novosphingobium ovatum]NBC38117.1 cytochrome P450 [Novosphingobium ovatum]